MRGSAVFFTLFLFQLINSTAVAPEIYIGEETGNYYSRVVSSSGSVPGVPATISFDHILTRFEFLDGLEGFSHAESESKGKVSIVSLRDGAISMRAAWRSRIQRETDHTLQCMQNATDSIISCNETREEEILAEFPWIDSPVIGPMTTSDSTYIVIRMRHLVHANEAMIRYRNESLSIAKEMSLRHEWKRPNYWQVKFPVLADGKYHLYAIPISSTRFAVPTIITEFSQLRVYPAVVSVENGTSYPRKDAVYDGTILMDYVRIATAPTILRIEGCSPIIYDNSDVGKMLKETDKLPPVVRPTVRRGYALNQYFHTIDEALLRVNASTDSSLPFACTYNCARRGGDRVVITGLHFGSSTPRVLIDQVPCTNVSFLHEQTSISCITPPGHKRNAIVTISNGDMPVLRDSKPFLSYAQGSVPPPRPVITNINAKAVDVSWVCPQDKWDCMTTTSYIVQWRMAVLDDVTVGDTTNSDIVPGAIIGTDAAGFIAERPIGSEDSSLHSGRSSSRIHSQAVQNDMISSVGVGRGDLDGDGLADDLYLDGVYVRDASSDGWSTQSQVFDDYGEPIPGPSPSQSGFLVDVPSGASYSFTDEALSQTRGAVRPFFDPSISGGTFVNGSYVPPVDRVPKRIAPDISWGPWGQAPGGGFVMVINQTSTTIIGLEQGRRYSFRIAALNEPTSFFAFNSAQAAIKAGNLDGGGYLAWAGTGSDLYGHRQRPAAVSGTVRSRYSLPSDDIRTLSFDFLFSKFDANNTLDHGPMFKNSSVNSLHWAGGEGHFGLVLVGDAQIGNCNASHTCCDGFGFGVDGGATFSDAIRFLDEWEQSRTHSPLYRFDSETMDFTPTALSWARERAAAEGINTGTVPLLMQTVNRGAHSAAVRQLVEPDSSLGHGGFRKDDTYEGLGDDLAAQYGADFTIKTGPRPLSHSGDVAGSAQPVLHRSRLWTADTLLARGLGRSPSSQSWFSIFEPKEEPVSVWESYDDAGTIAFVSTTLVKKLDDWALNRYLQSLDDETEESALYNSAISNGINGGTTEFIRWNYPGPGASKFKGKYNDTRVLWDEFTRGPLSPLNEEELIIVESNSTNSTNSTNFTSAPLLVNGSSFLSANLSSLNATNSSTFNSSSSTTGATSFPNTTKAKETRYSRSYTTIPRFVHRDKHGRRLVGLDSDPRSTCSLICTSASSARPPVLNSQTQRGTEVYPRGVFAGSRTRGTTINDQDDIVLVSTDDNTIGIDNKNALEEDYFTESAAMDGLSAYGPSTIQGAKFSSTNLSSGGIDYREGDPVTSAPISGRFSRASHPLGGVPFPYPDTTFPTSVVIVDAGNGERKSDFVESPPSKRPVATNATSPCGPALRLTASMSSQSGAAWYSRPQQVREGFDTTFIFRISSPSVHCRNMNDAHTRCRPKGGAGLAFVIQTMHPAALGNGSSGMGYAGIRRSVAVEFDTYADSEHLDPHENHISVQSRGANFGNSPNHTFSLGHAVLRANSELTDGIHVVRVLYEPNFPKRLVNDPAFLPSSYVSDWLASNEEGGGGGGGEFVGSDTGSGTQWEQERNLGALSIFVDDEKAATLIVPLSLQKLLSLDDTHGRAWVGFTAGTGADVWQAHDLLGWHFTSLRK
jgi:hypothetical protein